MSTRTLSSPTPSPPPATRRRGGWGVPLLALAFILPAACAGAAGGDLLAALDSVELADEPSEQAQGLMFRRELCPACGMLFTFEREAMLSFWMKNTYLPLDILFIDGEGRIVTVHNDAKPLDTKPRYASTAPARYVLEVNAGFAERHGLRVGQQLDREALLKKKIPYLWVNKEGEPAGGR